jgi:hypothetical protein
LAARAFPVGPGVQHDAAVRKAGNEGAQGPLPGFGDGQMYGIDRPVFHVFHELLYRREGMGQCAMEILDRLTIGGDQPAGVGSRSFGRYLLTQHRADGQFGLVDCARNALAGRLGHHRAHSRVSGECLDHRLRVGIEVEQPPAAGDRRREVAEIVEDKQAADVIDSRGQGEHRAAEGKPQAASERTVADLLATGHDAGGQVTEYALIGERCPYRQPNGHGARRRGFGIHGGEPGRGALTQCRRCVREHQAHGVVELTDAGKPGGECHIAERHVCGLDQEPRGLRTLRAGQRERAGAHLGLQQPLQLAGGVADVGGKAADSLAVHGAVGDEPHRPRDDVTAYVPFR